MGTQNIGEKEAVVSVRGRRRFVRGGRFGRGGGISGRGGGRGSYVRGNAAQVPQVTGAASAAKVKVTKKEGEYDRQSLPQLSDDQWSALLSFLSAQKAEPHDKLNSKTEYEEFIIGSGASHHMTGNRDYLCNVTDIPLCMIGLSDGDNAVTTKQGDQCLGRDVWLRGVLFSQELNCSLISVAKLLKVCKRSITFTDELCVLQDRTMKMVIGAGEECGDVYVFRGVMARRYIRL